MTARYDKYAPRLRLATERDACEITARRFERNMDRTSVRSSGTVGNVRIMYCTCSHKERADCLVAASANLHCRFPACRARVSHITPCITQNYAYDCQICRRETHVTSIKFILPAILLGNLSFVPWFRSHWPTTRMSLTDPPIAVIQRSIIV